MASILFVSKPVVPPWNDSGKNLVRDVARHMRKHRATIMSRAGAEPLPPAQSLAVYARHSGGFAPGLTDQARVFAHLLPSRGHAAWHFFFAPNPRSCLAGRVATRLRRVPSVHTLSSAPRDAAATVGQLFADVNVVLSAHTERLMLAAGLSEDRLVRIAPAIEPLTPFDAAERAAARRAFGLDERAPVIVYPGDLEFGGGAELAVDAMRDPALAEISLVLACRAKTARARGAELALRERVQSLGLSARVRFVGETANIHALLACSDVVVLPSTDLYAKMDYPLVLLEAMSLARPVIVAQGTPAAELCADEAALAVEARPDALSAALRALVEDAHARGKLGRAAARAVHTRYAAPNMASQYEAVYDRLLG
ncbi:MAG TPA: glycosyltransferase family 4 protein [Polyangiales bacterium]